MAKDWAVSVLLLLVVAHLEDQGLKYFEVVPAIREREEPAVQ